MNYRRPRTIFPINYLWICESITRRHQVQIKFGRENKPKETVLRLSPSPIPWRRSMTVLLLVKSPGWAGGNCSNPQRNNDDPLRLSGLRGEREDTVTGPPLPLPRVMRVHVHLQSREVHKKRLWCHPHLPQVNNGWLSLFSESKDEPEGTVVGSSTQRNNVGELPVSDSREESETTVSTPTHGE